MKTKMSLYDKALANAIRKEEISISDIGNKKKKKRIKEILSKSSIDELDKATKTKYKYSKRKIKHKSKKNNENMENKPDFKKIITNIDDWEDKVLGGLARNKKPSDYDIDSLSRGAQTQMEHTDDPEMAIDIAMDHLEEYEDYYDDEIGLPSMERDLENYDDDDDDYEDEDEDEDDDYEDDYEENYKKLENNKFIKNFKNFVKINENSNIVEPKMIPRENKFKRFIEYSEEVETTLIDRFFTKNSDIIDGEYIVFDLIHKTYEIVDNKPEDIRYCSNNREFDHIMNNL